MIPLSPSYNAIQAPIHGAFVFYILGVKSGTIEMLERGFRTLSREKEKFYFDPDRKRLVKDDGGLVFRLQKWRMGSQSIL